MFFLNIVLIRIDLRFDHSVVLAHQHLSHQAVRAESVFQFLGRNILSVFGNDQVLLAAGQKYKSVLVHIAQIACLQPSVFQCFGRLLWHLVISLHYAASLHPKLAVHCFCLAVGKKLSHGTFADIPFLVGADHRRTLGHAVSFLDGDVVFLKQIDVGRIQIGAAAAYSVELFAEHLAFYDFGRKQCRLLQFFRHGFDHQRNHEDHFRFKQFDILCHTHQRIIDADNGSQRNAFQNIHAETVCVMDGKHGHEHGAFGNLHIQTGCVLRNIPVGKHNTFAFSCCSGGKHDGTEILRLGRMIKTSLMFFKKRPERLGVPVVFTFLHGDQCFQLRTALLCHSRHVFAHFVVYKNSGIRPVDQIAHILRGKIHVKGNNHTAAVYGSKVGNQPRIGGHSDNRDMLSLLSHIPEKAGETLAVFFQLCVGF